MIDIIIREFSQDMLDECTDLFIKVFTREPWNDNWDSREDARRYLNSHCIFNSFLGFVAMNSGRIVGASFGHQKPWQPGMEYFINEFFVDPDLQRQGIGQKLMGEIGEALKIKNINGIILSTERGFPAHRFYEKLGFTTLENTVVMGLSL